MSMMCEVGHLGVLRHHFKDECPTPSSLYHHHSANILRSFGKFNAYPMRETLQKRIAGSVPHCKLLDPCKDVQGKKSSAQGHGS